LASSAMQRSLELQLLFSHDKVLKCTQIMTELVSRNFRLNLIHVLIFW
jgi:hypothetical protein